MGRIRVTMPAGLVAGLLLAVAAEAEPHAVPPEFPAATSVTPGEPRPALAARNSGPAARAHSRYRRGRHGTTRIIRRTPEVMREDAARVKRGDLFSTWSNEYLD